MIAYEAEIKDAIEKTRQEERERIFKELGKYAHFWLDVGTEELYVGKVMATIHLTFEEFDALRKG